uniref:Thioesterase n=1 Tax=Kwoniella dejecticola CBS 10117 TaxID=1296121 RepID=A0A1A6AGC6_9TREE|nr:thioesterase [Kwoniella dejecticola CBS 10117]OBR89122.1 thioesterase [Kwoniella dejecticola CBS 10117]
MTASLFRTTLRAGQASTSRASRFRHTATCHALSQARYNSSASPSSSNTSTSPAPTPTPSQQLYTLNEIDKLTASIAESAFGPVHHPSPLVMRALPAPWLSSHSPDLASQTDSSAADGPETKAPEPISEEVLLRPKHMSESFTSFDLPLASDTTLYERYVNTSGGFRMGKLLEHLDSLAGAVAYRHCLPTPRASYQTDSSAAFHEMSSRAGLYLATASADRLDMFGRLNRENVRQFSGFVTWTGRSSLEVVVKMEGRKLKETPGQYKTLMLGRFAMVCRDSKTHKARQVPKLLVESQEEKVLWAIGEEHQKRRKTSAMNALDKVPPSSEEAEELHKLMLEVSSKEQIDGETVVPMQDTEIQTVQLMFPQDRNLHGKVFGGILMRLWVPLLTARSELCFTNAALFAQAPMRYLSLDQIGFLLPVPIGAVLRLSSKVVKTTRPHDGPDGEAKAHIMVRAEVEEVDTGVRRETNTFFFTMAKEDNEPIGRTIVPSTYMEAMHYLEGKRRLEMGEEMRRLYKVGRSQ